MTNHLQKLAAAGVQSALSIGISCYLLEHGPTSTRELADYFERDMKAVKESLLNLKRHGWIIRTGYKDHEKMSTNRRTGELMKTTGRNGVYGATDKLMGLIE